MRVHFGDQRLFSVFPGGPGQIYGWAACPSPDKTLDPTEGRHQRIFATFSPLGREPACFLGRADGDGSFSCTPPEWVRMASWHSGCLVLIGDAAHACLPFMAQGACLAMEDALALAACLDTLPVPEALVAYQARRQPRAGIVQDVVALSCQSLTSPVPVSTVVDVLRRAGTPQQFAQMSALLEPL